MGCDNNCTAWKIRAATIYHADPDIAGLGVRTLHSISNHSFVLQLCTAG